MVRVLESRGISVWFDASQLRPGESWDHAIELALQAASIVLIFISPQANTNREVAAEVELAVNLKKIIVPVELGLSGDAAAAGSFGAFDQFHANLMESARRVADLVARVLADLPEPTAGQAAPPEQAELARRLAEQARLSIAKMAQSNEPPDSVFIAHGHDEAFLREVERYVIEIGVQPIIMKDVGGPSKSLLEKFLIVGGAARYAIVLLSGDDLGASRRQFEEPDVAERALQFRARQNVILELGFFYGQLGWENVFVLEADPPRLYPNFERPSDLAGAVFVRYGTSGLWREQLRKQLTDAGFQLKFLGDA